VLTERSRGEGFFTEHFVSASLDEQFMSVPECSPSGAEVKGFLLNIFDLASLDEQFMNKA
jgi:hypothetical protein